MKKEKNNVLIHVIDNGIGFNLTELSNKDGFGLIGIRERINILNGKFELNSSKGSGTKVKIKVPINYENSISR